jgi:hypothetical protein
MKRQLRIVTVRVGRPPAVESIDHCLEGMQAVVGGWIEARRVNVPGIVAVCNEESMLEDLPPNGCGFLGPYFFVRDGGDGEFAGVTDADVVAIGHYWMAHRHQSHPSQYRDDIGFIFTPLEG